MSIIQLVLVFLFQSCLQWSMAMDYFFQPRSKDCERKCDRIPSFKEYEQCIKRCNNYFEYTKIPEGHLDITYASPPKNANVEFDIFTEKNRKYLSAVVRWELEPDVHREAIYLSFLATETQPYCEEKFQGYHTQNIPATDNFFQIPLMLPNHQPLELEYGCTYRVELHSIPYPYGDPSYATIINPTVPKCVKEICNCREQLPLPEPRNVRILSFWDSAINKSRAKVTWTYRHPSQKDHQGADFHVNLADLHRPASVPPWRKIFKWRQNFDEVVKTDVKKTEYFLILPVLENGKEFKINVFTLNRHFCRSKEIFKEFKINLIPYTNFSLSHEATTEAPKAPVFPAVQWSTGSPLILNTTFKVTITLNNDTSGEVVLPDRPREVKNGRLSDYIVLILPILIVIILVIIACIVWTFYSGHRDKLAAKKKYLERMKLAPWTNSMTASQIAGQMETNVIYTEKEIIAAQERGLADSYEISYGRIWLGPVIGRGAFRCLVYRGTADAINGISGPSTVAIKQLAVTADQIEKEDFLSEIATMKQVGHHPNIVSMYGCCTLQPPLCMVMEYVPYGDLHQYLKNLRKEYEKVVDEYRTNIERDYVMSLSRNSYHRSPTPSQSMTASVISDGGGTIGGITTGIMDTSFASAEHGPLSEQIPFVDSENADEANCNCVTDLTYSLDPIELQNFALQVASGMAHLESLRITHRDLAARNVLVGRGKILKISDFGMSRQGIYVKTTSGRIPLRWLSIEAMRDHVYTTKSDVWAYGVVLWEICTLGGFPYPSIADKDLLNLLENNHRLEKPSSCSEDIYHLMTECWAYCPNHRPSFSHVQEKLCQMNTERSLYVDFNPRQRSELPPPEEYCTLTLDS